MPRPHYPRLIPTRAISSVYGKIEQVLLAYPGGKPNVMTEDILERYGEILDAFTDRVTFVIMGHFGGNSKEAKAARKAFEEALVQSNLDPSHHLILCHTPRAGGLNPRKYKIHGEYIQDPFVVMETEDGAPVLLEPIQHPNPKNQYVAEQLAVYSGFLIQPIDVKMEGGNILIGDDYALVGKNVLRANRRHGHWSRPMNAQKGLENYLKRILGLRYVFWIGMEEAMDLGPFHSTGAEKLQPFFHIDLFITLCGKNASGDEIVLLGEIVPNFVSGKEEEDWAILEQINRALNAVGLFLQGIGEVCPGPKFDVRRISMGGKVETNLKGERCFTPYSCNNAHVEWYRGINRIYLPYYDGMDALKAKVSQELHGWGFDRVKFIRSSFEEYAKYGGSLHCISSVLSRSNY